MQLSPDTQPAGSGHPGSVAVFTELACPKYATFCGRVPRPGRFHRGCIPRRNAVPSKPGTLVCGDRGWRKLKTQIARLAQNDKLALSGKDPHNSSHSKVHGNTSQNSL